MTKTQTQPRFVNLQVTAVQVFTETRHPITILPWAHRLKNPNGRYVVEGVHYQQFVSGNGPLYPFPVDESNPPEPLAETEDARHARLVAEVRRQQDARAAAVHAPHGKVRASAEVVHQGVVVGTTAAAFVQQLRRGLAAAGIVTAHAFRTSPKEALLAVEGITPTNLPRVR